MEKTSTAIKPRLVRCPKCRKLLLELGDLPVYKCGGCGATLKAKYSRYQEPVNSEAGNSTQEESEQDCEGKELASSNGKATQGSNGSRGIAESSDSNCANSGGLSIRTTIPSTGDITCHKEDSVSCTEEKREADGNNGKESGLTTRISSSGDINCHEEDSEPFTKEKREAYRKNVKDSGLQSPGPERREMYEGSTAISSSERPYGESVLSRINNSPITEQMELSPVIPRRRRFIEAEETTEPIDDSLFSEEDLFDDTNRDTSGPQKNGSYHAYDGSVSSYGGWDDQFSDQYFHLSKRSSFEDRMVAASAGRERRQKTESEKTMNKDEGLLEQRKLPLISFNKKDGSISLDNVGCKHDESQTQEEVSSGYSEEFHPIKTWLGMEKQGLVSKERFRSVVSGKGSHSSNEYGRSSSLYTPNNLEFFERNQMELLRKVDELRDQFNRSYTFDGANGGRPTRAIRQEKQSSLYCKQKALDNDRLQRYDGNFPHRPQDAYRRRSSLPPQFSYPEEQLSGKSMSYGHHRNCLCSHCYQEDWHHRKLPPTVMSYSEGLCGAHPSDMLYTPYASGPSSPRRRLHSHYPLRSHELQTQHHEKKDAHYPFRSREIRVQPQEQIDIDRELEQLQYRERRQSTKRHSLPLAGAAPFVICYYCSDLLHLPADFLISTKGHHRLQCSSCSEVLIFSLQRRTHLVRYTSNLAAPNPASTSRPNNSPQADHVSYSEDYGLSAGKSGSTEATRGSAEPTFSPIQNESRDKDPTSNSFRKLSVRLKQKKSVEASDSSSSSSTEVTSEKSQLRPAAAGSPLHRLMGYSSATELIFGPGDDCSF